MKRILKITILLLATLALVSSQNLAEEVDYAQKIRDALNLYSSESDLTVWSPEYLLDYIKDSDIKDVKEYAKTMEEYFTQAQTLEDAMFMRIESGLFSKRHFTATNDVSEYLYMGSLKDNKPSGFGVMSKYYEIDGVYAYLPVYIGEFSKGNYNGTGISLCDYSENDDVLSELNRYDINEDNVYDYARQYLQLVQYIGDFSSGEKNGKGIWFEHPNLLLSSMGLEDIDLTIYISKFKKGKLNGKGKVYYHEMILYEGEFHNDEIEGKGTMYYQDSTQVKYEGELKNGKYDGKGTLYDENGEIIYKGKWDNGDYAD